MDNNLDTIKAMLTVILSIIILVIVQILFTAPNTNISVFIGVIFFFASWYPVRAFINWIFEIVELKDREL